MPIPFQTTLSFRVEGNVNTLYTITSDIQKSKIDVEYFNQVSDASSGVYQVRFTGSGKVFIKLPENINPILPFQRDQNTSELRLAQERYYQTRIKVWVRGDLQNTTDRMTVGIVNDAGDVIYGWGLYYDDTESRWCYTVVISGTEQYLGSERYYSPSVDQIYEVVLDVWRRDPSWGFNGDYMKLMWRLFDFASLSSEQVVYENSSISNGLDYNNMRVGIVVNGSTLELDYIRVIQGMGVW